MVLRVVGGLISGSSRFDSGLVGGVVEVWIYEVGCYGGVLVGGLEGR